MPSGSRGARAVDVKAEDTRVVVELAAPLDLPISIEGLTDTTVAATGSAVVRVEDWPVAALVQTGGRNFAEMRDRFGPARQYCLTPSR